MDARHAEGGMEGAPYLQYVGIPPGRLSEAARRVLRVLQIVLQAAPLPWQCGERREPPASGQRLAVQRELFRSDVHPRALIERRTRLGGLPDRLQRFRVFARRRADVQSDPRAAAGARGEGIRRAHQAVQSIAPADRSSQSSAQQLLRLSVGVASVQSPATILALIDSNSESLMSFASSISRACRKRRAGSDSAPAASGG